MHSLGHPTTLLAHIEVKVRTASRCSGLRNMTRGSSFTRRWPHGQRDQMGFPQWLFAESIEEVSVKVLPLKEQMEWRNTSAQIICKDCEACLRTLHQKPTGMARDTRHPCVFLWAPWTPWDRSSRARIGKFWAGVWRGGDVCGAHG